MYLWYSLFQAQWNRYDQRNYQTYNYLVKGHHIAEREIKGSGLLLLVFLEKPLHEVCLIRIKEQVSGKRSTVCTHGYADCLLKNTSTKDNKYVVNQKNSSILMISVSGNFLIESVVFCQKQICPFLSQWVFYLRWPFFFMKYS